MKVSNEEKMKYLTEWKKSGIKAWTFAKEKGLCPQTFTKWVKKGKKKRNNFVEVGTKIKTPFENGHEILVEKGELKIKIPTMLGQEGLRMVINALGVAE